MNFHKGVILAHRHHSGVNNKTERYQGDAERTIKDARQRTRKRDSSEEKIRIALADFSFVGLSVQYLVDLISAGRAKRFAHNHREHA